MSFQSVTKLSIFSLLNAMNPFMLKQRWNFLQIIFQNKDSLLEIGRKWRTKFGHREKSILSDISKLLLKFVKSFSLLMHQKVSMLI